MRLVTMCVLVAALAACSKPLPASAFVDDYAAWTTLDDDAQRLKSHELTARWQGKRVRWQALAVAGLCVKAAGGDTVMTCAINPFPRSGKSAAAAATLGGMFPLYRLSASSWATLQQHCAKRESCVVDVEARLLTLQLDPELPLALTFDAAVVHSGRAPQADDGWQRPAPPPQAVPGAAVPGVDPARALVSGLRVAAPTF